MGKFATFLQSLVSVALLGAICYGGYNIYTNLSVIPISNDETIGNSDINLNNPEDSSITDVTNIDDSENNIMFRNVQVDNFTMNSGNLVCVNSENYTDYNYNNLELSNMYENRIPSYSVNDIDVEISYNVINEFNTMISDFNQSTGNDTTMVRLAYISKKELSDYTKCDHVTGLAFNLSSYDGQSIHDFNGSGDFSWIAERADKYGFIQRYPYDKLDITGIDESSHFRYVGLPHSSYMKENNLCLEEYITLIKDYKYNEPLEYTTFNGRTYNIYYIPVDENNPTTNIPILMDKEYSISGNNIDGFIVTVKVSG